MKKTRASWRWAAGAADRLSIFRGFPTRDTGMFEMMNQIISMCPTQEDGDWLISYAIKTEEFFPSVARLREILADHRCKPSDDDTSGLPENDVGKKES